MRHLLPLLLAAATQAEDDFHHDETNLFDKVYTMHMRDGHLIGRDKGIPCDPFTLEECDEKERRFIDHVKDMQNSEALKKETAKLVKEEREAFSKGKPYEGEDEHWLFQRKSILYHFRDDLEAKEKAEMRRRWAESHDDL